MRRFNVVVPKKYFVNGEERTQWNNVGSLVHFPANGQKDEGYVLELAMFPNTTFKVFAQKEKEDNGGGRSPAPRKPNPANNGMAVDPDAVDNVEYPEEEINLEDIPF